MNEHGFSHSFGGAAKNATLRCEIFRPIGKSINVFKN
jgi:hypothetical protein